MIAAAHQTWVSNSTSQQFFDWHSTPWSLPINASGVLAGNAKPRFPVGDPGKVDVVQIGELSKDAGGATLPVVIRNNTDKGVAHVDLSAVARGSSGKVVATGSSQGFEPAQIQPGEPALGFIYFGADKPFHPPERPTPSRRMSSQQISRLTTPPA
jgi:hypothetical protein